MNALYQRYSWVSNELNKKAYADQMKGRTSPLKQFMPCDKALVFTDAITRKKVTQQVMPLAALTNCPCHRGMGESELWKLFDQSGEAVKSC